MRVRVQHGLPFVAAEVEVGGLSVGLGDVLIDTGSAGTILSADRLLDLGIKPAPDDPLTRIRGVGGAEWVFSKTVTRLSVGPLVAAGFVVQVGALDYGLPLDAIIGMDFLLRVGARIDLRALELGPGN